MSRFMIPRSMLPWLAVGSVVAVCMAEAGVARAQVAYACQLPVPSGEITKTGTVVATLSVAQAQQVLSFTETQKQASINPAYLKNTRAVLEIETPSGGRRRVIALMPLGEHIRIGAQVTYNLLRRDMTMPCGYIPSVITRWTD